MSDNGKALADKPAADAFGRVFVLTDVGTLKQRDAVAWNRAYLTHGARAAMADERQAALQAAIVAGWIVEPATRWEDVTDSEGKSERRHYLGDTQVDELTPAEVAYYGLQCSRMFDEAMTVPKPLSSR